MEECFHVLYDPHFFAHFRNVVDSHEPDKHIHIDHGFNILFMFWMCKTPCLLNSQVPTYHSKNWIALQLVEASLALEQEHE